MRAAVLGATGFVGVAVSEALRQSAITVIPVAGPRIVAGEQVTPESWLADVAAGSEIAELEHALSGADVVVNCAGLATPGAPASDALYGANALLPSVVHQAAHRAGISRMVHLSSAAVQGDRAVLDETEDRSPLTPYGAAKSEGERLLLTRASMRPALTILRATSVHGPGRGTSAALARLARSRFSSVAGVGGRHSPQVLVQNVGYCVALLLAEDLDPPLIVLQPSEGHTTRSVLTTLGMGHEPRQIPDQVARATLASARLAERSSRLTAARRRLSMLWFGQEQVPGWLSRRGFVPVAGPEAWADLALTLANAPSRGENARRMKVGLFSQWYDPEPGPASLPGVYARALAGRGHQVRVLTGFPNYPEGHLYPGYGGRWPKSEIRDGIAVRRVPLYPHHGSSALGRVANYTSFALSASLLGSRDFASADAMWVYNSPATIGVPLMLHSRLHRTPYLLHVQDLWPDSVVNSGMLPSGTVGRIAETSLTALVDRIDSAAAEIAVISPSVRTMLIDRGVPDEKINYVPNPTDETVFYPRARNSELRQELLGGASPDTVVVMYAGSLGHVQALECAIEAMSHLRDRAIRLVLVGSGIAEQQLRALVSRLALTSVEFLGRRPPASIPELMAAADGQLVSLREDAFLAATTPSKVPAILASAQPVVAAMAGDGAELLRRSGAAVVCSPGDSSALAEAISLLAGHSVDERAALGRSGREFYLRHMSTERTAATVEAILRRIAGTA